MNGIINLCTDNSNLLRLNDIPAGEAKVERKFPLRDDPLLADDVPVGQVTAHKLKANSLALASLEVDLLETTKLLGRCTSRCALGEANVQLGDASAADLSRVGKRDGNVVNRLPEGGVATGHDGAVLGVSGDVVGKGLGGDIRDVEGSVGETKTELVADRDVVGIEVTVVNLELLVEPGLPVKVSSGVDGGGRRSVVVRTVQGNGVGKVTARVVVTVEDVSQ